MVSLLVVSVALGAAAPMISKKINQANVGNSKWSYTQNGKDITRQTGKVGIGVSRDPQAKLEVQNNSFGPPLSFLVKNSGKNTFSVDSNGKTEIDGPLTVDNTATVKTANINTATVETANINTANVNGTLSVNTTGKALSIKNNGIETVFINADGTNNLKLAETEEDKSNSYGGICWPDYSATPTVIFHRDRNQSTDTTEYSGTVPFDGWLRWVNGTRNGGEDLLYINGNLAQQHFSAEFAKNYLLYLPVKKGDTYRATSGKHLDFLPCR